MPFPSSRCLHLGYVKILNSSWMDGIGCCLDAFIKALCGTWWRYSPFQTLRCKQELTLGVTNEGWIKDWPEARALNIVTLKGFKIKWMLGDFRRAVKVPGCGRFRERTRSPQHTWAPVEVTLWIMKCLFSSHARCLRCWVPLTELHTWLFCYFKKLMDSIETVDIRGSAMVRIFYFGLNVYVFFV